MKNKEYRICVCIDVQASSAEEAYSRVYDMMMNIEPAQAWESTDEWFEDGAPMDEESMSRARMAKGFSVENTPSVPCSFCHATGFVGTCLCQECKGKGVEHGKKG
jgi:hypothetical protein